MASIVICVDREDREMSAAELHDRIISAIRDEGVTDNIILGVPDRMIENWILADKSVLKKYALRRQINSESTDGLNGKSVLRSLISDYHETTVVMLQLELENPLS